MDCEIQAQYEQVDGETQTHLVSAVEEGPALVQCKVHVPMDNLKYKNQLNGDVYDMVMSYDNIRVLGREGPYIFPSQHIKV